MPDPTVLEFLGFAVDDKGKIVNLRDYRSDIVLGAVKRRAPIPVD